MIEEGNKVFDSWEDVIKDFFQMKIDNEVELYYKKMIKEIGDLYRRERFFGSEEKKDFFDTKKNKKKIGEKDIDFLECQFSQIYSWAEKPPSLNINDFKNQIKKEKSKIISKFEPNNWLTWASKNAKNVIFSTHVFKLTHSAIDSLSVSDQVDESSACRLTTSSLNDLEIDGAVQGNQYSPIFQFLELTFLGEKLATQFDQSNCLVLEPFAKSAETIFQWNNGFYKSLEDRAVSAHGLLKQTFFPLGDNKQQYHILCNIISSSLAHSLFRSVRVDQKNSINTEKKGKYMAGGVTHYPGLASLAVTASNHGNASQLNAKRGGKLKLITCQPPTWQSQFKPPVFNKSLFFEPSIFWKAKDDIDYLRDFLIRFESIELSIKNPKRKKWVEQWVRNIIDEVLFYITNIQSLDSGWSADIGCRLKLDHQYLLDPYRNDDDFQTKRKNTDWESIVCSDFSDWLNYKLVGKDKLFTPQVDHRRLWHQLFEPELRELNEILEFKRKHNGGEGL